MNLHQVMLAKGATLPSPHSGANNRMIATKESFEPQSSEPLPNSKRAYVAGRVHPDVRVPFREVQLSPTKGLNGREEANEPVRVYDCSGPWGDPAFGGNPEQGLPALRRDWILKRGDVEEAATTYRPVPGRSTVTMPAGLKRQSLRAKSGQAVTQLYYARKGVITPEMEYIAIRENLGREEAAGKERPFATPFTRRRGVWRKNSGVYHTGVCSR